MDWKFEFDEWPSAMTKAKRSKPPAPPNRKTSLADTKQYIRDRKSEGKMKGLMLGQSKKNLHEELKKMPGKHYGKKHDKRGRKKSKAPNHFHLALKKHGYLKKGGAFKPIPKKGSAEHKKVSKTHEDMKCAFEKRMHAREE